MNTFESDSLIYAVAAYTITIASLTLYGVVLQHRGRVFAHARDSILTAEGGRLQRGFNVGAALLSPLWMLRHGMPLPGALLLALVAALIPLYARGLWIPALFVAIVPLAAGAALGFVGNRIAVRHRGDETVAEFAASQLPWAAAGVLLYAGVLPWIWYAIQANA